MHDVRQANKTLYTKQVQNVLPYVISKAIIVGFED